jgi:hypothetical protein
VPEIHHTSDHGWVVGASRVAVLQCGEVEEEWSRERWHSSAEWWEWWQSLTTALIFKIGKKKSFTVHLKHLQRLIQMSTPFYSVVSPWSKNGSWTCDLGHRPPLRLPLSSMDEERLAFYSCNLYLNKIIKTGPTYRSKRLKYIHDARLNRLLAIVWPPGAAFEPKPC